MAIATKPPTSELGTTSQSAAGGLLPWGAFLDDQEIRVPELVWPNSIATYDVMRTDAQIAGLHAGCTLPIRRYRWLVDPNGSRDVVCNGVADDLGLDIKGREPKPRGRSKGKFNHDDHLRHALLALLYGHMFTEQVGEITEDGLWHLRKLAPRMPKTIAEIRVAKDGGLEGIKQNMTSNVGLAAPIITTDRLVAFVWDKEGGSWVGRSLLRPLYRSWLLKDRLLRIDTMKHERNGLGTPFFEAPPGAGRQEIQRLDAMARAIKVGKDSGGAYPSGAKLTLKGVDGSIPDTLASIRYHDEAMARALLMMFLQLGQTETGSRSLGGSFIDYFQIAQETLAIWYANIMTSHVIEDWVDWNYGEDEAAPVLIFEKDDEPNFAIRDLSYLIKEGAVVVDDETEEAIREQVGLPDKGPDAPPRVPLQPAPPPAPPAAMPAALDPVAPEASPPTTAAKRRTRAVEAADLVSPVMLPDRPLRRRPYPHEIRSSADFAAIDAVHTSHLSVLSSSIRTLRISQIQELHDQVVAAKGSVPKLAALSAKPVYQDTIYSQMTSVANHSATLATQEANRQGKSIEAPTLDRIGGRLQARAAATDVLLSRAVSDSASRKAIQLTGGSQTAAEVAGAVKDYLSGLAWTGLDDQLTGALMSAANDARGEVFGESNPSSIYASELLDNGTCESCIAIDGTEYADMDQASADYPTGGYSDCDGGTRCRGTLVAVYDEAVPSSEDAGGA